MMCFSCRVTSDAKVVFLDVIPTPQDIISDFSYICLLLTIKFEYMENISRRTAIKTFLAGGVGFGECGEGYFRLTAFGDAEKTKVAAQRIKAAIKAL